MISGEKCEKRGGGGKKYCLRRTDRPKDEKQVK
jgi:hypothetical protein